MDAAAAPRAKLLCSFGGTFLPRPLDGKLRYVGGETRILSLSRPVLSSDLLACVARLFPAVRSLKYQPPDEDLDALVSLLDDDDVANMLEEHDRLRRASPVPIRLRLFAFADQFEHEAALLHPRFDADQREVERRYVDALNSSSDSIHSWTPPDGFPGNLGHGDGHRRNCRSPRVQFDCRFASSYGDELFGYDRFGHRHHFGPLLSSGNYGSAHFGMELGSEPYYCHGPVRGQQDSTMWHGNGGWGYGSDGIYHVPYGPGLNLTPSEHVHRNLQSGAIGERSDHILQTNLAVNFNYNQSVQVGNSGLSWMGVDEQFAVPRMGYNTNVPLPVDGLGSHLHQQEGSMPELNTDNVKLDYSQSSSLAPEHYHLGREGSSGSWGLVHLPTSSPSIISNRPMVALSPVEQPLRYVNKTNLYNGAEKQETAVETHKFGNLSREFGIDAALPTRGFGEGSTYIVTDKFDASHPDEIGKHSSPELINSLRKTTLEGLDEAEVPTHIESNVNFVDDGDKIAPPSHLLEPQSELKDSEVFSDGDQVVAKIEPTVAEAEAIQKGLQTIRNDDLEEVSALGTGAYGAVYRGKWKGCDVAIKRIKASCFSGKLSERERLIADFWKEALILSSLHHPNVLTFYGIVRDAPDGNLATVTEFMVNGSLKKFLQKKDRTIDRRKRLIIARDVAFGMEYLHAKNIVHFDLKCDNLLVNMRDPHRPICKIGDLGLSKVKQHTFVSGGVRGTLPWMAPELLSGRNHRVSEKVDVYSFGIVMWELLTGEEPYAEMHCASVIGGIINGTLRPQIPGWCDPEWRSLMASCWSTEPGERPSFAEISCKLQKMVEAINLK